MKSCSNNPNSPAKMIFNLLLRKVKAFFLLFVNLFRRALCCIRKRRNSYGESVQLTHVVSGSDNQTDAPTWTEWGDDAFRDKPKTVQDYIEQYREQTLKSKDDVPENPEEQKDFFENMAPQITRQTKVLVRTRNDSASRRSFNNRLNAVEDNVNVIPSGELGEWDENSGWEGEQLLDQEAQKVLREQKRLEREKRAWEQHQKRLEKTSRTLGSKMTT